MNIQKSIGQAKTTSSAQVSPEHLLSTSQIIRVSALGIFFWFVFAMAIRLATGMGLLGGLAGVATFVLSIPIGWLLVVAIREVGRLSTRQLMPGVGISLAAATLCDGVALTWAPWLYGNEPGGVLLGAAYILWGVGVIFIAAYVMAAANRRQTD